MKRFGFILMSSAFAVLLAVDVTYFCGNSAVLSQLNASSTSNPASSNSNTATSSTLSSSASSTNTSSTNTSSSTAPGDQQEKTLTGRSLYVTKITASGSINAHVGMRLSNGISGELKGKVEAEMMDEYKIECYPNGECPCTSMDWHACASSGCPKAGTKKKCS